MKLKLKQNIIKTVFELFCFSSISLFGQFQSYIT